MFSLLTLHAKTVECFTIDHLRKENTTQKSRKCLLFADQHEESILHLIVKKFCHSRVTSQINKLVGIYNNKNLLKLTATVNSHHIPNHTITNKIHNKAKAQALSLGRPGRALRHCRIIIWLRGENGLKEAPEVERRCKINER